MYVDDGVSETIIPLWEMKQTIVGGLYGIVQSLCPSLPGPENEIISAPQ